MALEPLRSALGLLGLTAGMTVVLLGGSAHAAPPTEADFRITYFATDEFGVKDRQLSTQDMTSLVGQARCECEQQIVARISRTSTPMVDNVQVLAMVGQQCAMAQLLPGVSPYSLCAQLVAGLPTVFQNGAEFRFDPIWLAYGVKDVQDIAEAEPDGACTSLYGQGGIWMCAGATACMMADFFMQGASNSNIAMGGTAQGISFDFVPPLTPPTDFEAQPGDSAVNIVWNATSVADISGYRVLCADADGNPVDGAYKLDIPTATSLVNGQLYFTRDNLCPGGPFGENYTPDGMGWDETGTDTGSTDSGTDSGTDSTSTDSGTDSSSSDTECTPGAEGCACVDGTCDEGLACTNDICDPIACQAGEYGCLCDAGACDPGYECSPQNFCGLPTTGVESLDWRYVCTPHIAGNSQSARIEGLENGVEYQFLVVAYDFAGNPLSSGAIIKASPIQTNGLWEQCEAQGNICGEPGFCAVVEPSRSGVGWGLAGLALIGLAGWGVRARRRRSA